MIRLDALPGTEGMEHLQEQMHGRRLEGIGTIAHTQKQAARQLVAPVPPQWRVNIQCYTHNEVTTLRFDEANFTAAQAILQQVIPIPHAVYEHRTIVVPNEAIPLFLGLSFQRGNVIPPDADLPPGELRELLRGTIPY